MNKSPIESFIEDLKINDKMLLPDKYRKFINDIKHFEYNDFIIEYEKIQNKKSSLSLRSREFINRLVVSEFQFILENDPHRIENGEVVSDN